VTGVWDLFFAASRFGNEGLALIGGERCGVVKGVRGLRRMLSG